MLANVPEPWRSFLEDIDASIGKELGLEVPINLHCVGGFVVAMCYDLQRSTGDLDIFEIVPAQALRPLLEVAGPGSDLARKHRLYIDAGSRVATLPESYTERLTELFPETYRHIKLFALDPYDLALSKLGRNSDRDQEDVLILAQAAQLDMAVLQERYHAEVRPFVHGPLIRNDGTLAFWIEMINEVRQAKSPS